MITPAIVPLPSNHDTDYPPTGAEVPPHLPSGLPHELGGSTSSYTSEPSGHNRAHMCINGHMADSRSNDNPVDLSRGAKHHHPTNGDLPHSGGGGAHPTKGGAPPPHLHNIHHHPMSNTGAIKREHFHNEHSDRVITGGYPPHNGVPSGRTPHCE